MSFSLLATLVAATEPAPAAPDPEAASFDPLAVLKYASIPVIAALIGYGTNVVAIQMTFLPIQYFGIGEAFFRKWGFSAGWQGIIPANAEKMARKSVQLMTTKLFSVEEVFSRLDPVEIARATESVLLKCADRASNAGPAPARRTLPR
jgi:uncharacterized membrane protein YheB (UPF0754 family)